MKRILIIDNSSGFTGAFKSIFQATQKLSSKFEFSYLIPKGSMNLEQLQSLNFTVLEYRFLEISKSLKTILYIPLLIYNAIKISNYIRKYQISILHVNDIYNMLGVLAKLLNPQIRLIYHVRLLPNSYVKILYPIWKTLGEKYADKIICVSELVAKNFSKEKAIIIYDAIEIPSHSSVNNHDSQKNIFKILYLANYTIGKGHRQAIEAYSKALPKLKNTQLVFFGGTLKKVKNKKFKESLMKYTQDQGISENILFNGFLSTPENEIVAADLMLNFSESESFSMTTLEALAYGVPIIATNCGGPSEIIEDGKSGIIVPVNDIDSMAKAIELLANNKLLRTYLSENGPKRVKMKFSFEDQINKLENIYNRLLM